MSDKLMDEKIGTLLVDAITERANAFRVGSVHYAIYPPSLGVHLLTSSLIEVLSKDSPLIQHNQTAELLRLAVTERETALRIIALNTLRGYDDTHDERKIAGRVKHLAKHLSPEEIATLLGLILSDDGYGEIIQGTGIGREQEERARVASLKQDKSTLAFGANTLYGSLIDQAGERYGWTMDYIVWGISYLNLRLLLADATTQVYLSEDEQKRMSEPRYSADDPKAQEEIARLLSQ